MTLDFSRPIFIPVEVLLHEVFCGVEQKSSFYCCGISPTVIKRFFLLHAATGKQTKVFMVINPKLILQVTYLSTNSM